MSSIKRSPHVLRREKTLAIPRHIIFCDTETDPVTLPDGEIEHRLKLGWACYLRRAEPRRIERQVWKYFTTLGEFWDFVLDYAPYKNRLWIITHNLSFDFTVLQGWKHLGRAGFKVKFFYSNGTTTLIKVKGKGNSILFVDSLNWFRESLEKLGDRLGIPKLAIDFETATVPELKTYCRRDVNILIEAFKALVAYLVDNRISRLCYTIGSTAMAAYLFRHYDYKIHIHNNAEALSLERESYRGGRTECFYLGELNHGPYYVLDVNSLYPFVMREHLYPVKYVKMCRTVSLSLLSDYLKKHAVVAKVGLQTDQALYAVKQQRTIFPLGRFTCTLTTPELKYALASGHIQHIEIAVLYEQAPIFTTFVDRFYNLRNQFKAAGNPLFEHFTKILMNSLYGKFGQKAEDWKLIGVCPGEPDRVEDLFDLVTGGRRRLRFLLGEIFEMTGHTEARHSFPAVSSHVTAYARLYLWHLLQIAAPGNYYYCDTDSLFVNQAGYDRLTAYLHPTRLGLLKVEYQTPTLTIYGLKDYVTSTKQVIKGIRKNAIRVSDNVYRQARWPSLAGILRTDDASRYQTTITEKHLNRTYTKGIVTPGGWIEPFALDDAPLFHPES